VISSEGGVRGPGSGVRGPESRSHSEATGPNIGACCLWSPPPCGPPTPDPGPCT